MNWERVKSQLEQVVNAPLHFAAFSAGDWQAMGGGPTDTSVGKDGVLYFPLGRDGGAIRTLAIAEVLLTASERRLVEMMLEALRSQEKRAAGSAASEEERRMGQVKEWLEQQLDLGAAGADMPDAIAAPLSMYQPRVPLLLHGSYGDSKRVSYPEMKKLLDSFFDADISLLPLKEKEWLILGSENILTESRSEDRDWEDEESVEESLASIAQGLHEMMMTEGIGECHIAIAPSVIPAKSLVSTVILLRECIALGRMFHVGQSIHLPWQLHLERLLQLIGDNEKVRYLESVLRGVDHVLDAETMTTLEQFFELDCNVSETAKRLYIHRNTLLYRLDKFKNETGLDVRRFHHAVLVKIALLLYKVTKR